MSQPKRQANSSELLGLLQHVQDLLQSQSLFLGHLAIESFQTNAKLFDKICDYNNEMKAIIERLMSIAPPVEKV